MKIMAIDLGMSRSVFCVLDTRTGEVRFGTVLSIENGGISGAVCHACLRSSGRLSYDGHLRTGNCKSSG